MSKQKKQHYRFWRWLILSVVHIPKLYILVWGLVGLCALAVLKGDVVSLVLKLLQ